MGKSKNKNIKLRIGSWIIFAYLITAILGPIFYSIDPRSINLSQELCSPSLNHPLGCDGFGIDLLGLIIYGSRISLMIGICTTLMNIFFGLIVGSMAAYGGKAYDSVISGIIDVIFAFPGLVLAIAISGVLGPGMLNIFIALTITGWASYARIVRAEVLAVKELGYIEAAQAIGLGGPQIILRHIWPNIAPTIIIISSFGIAHMIIAEAGLSFLGIGLPIGTPSWGSLLNNGREFIVEAPQIVLYPGICLLGLIFGLNLLGEGLRDYLDPKSD